MAVDLTAVTGSGRNSAQVYDRFGAAKVTDLPGAATLRWGRILGDISTATVTMPAPGTHGPGSACCGMLGNIHTWTHSLVITRSGERVWEGPITRVTWRRDTVTIDASDVMAWLTKRVVVQRRVKTALSVLDEGVLLMRRAIGNLSIDNLNVPVNSTIGAAGGCNTISRDLRNTSGYYDDDMQSLADAGLNFTAIGRSVLLWCDEAVIGRTRTLVPENHLADDVDIIESGVDLSTRSTARNDADASGTSAPLNEAYYGAVENLLTAEKVPDPASLAKVALRDRNRRNPTPLLISIPDSTLLLPSAPHPVRMLVPGVVVPVQSFATCRPVQGTSILGAVEVAQDRDGERVGISLIPLTASAVP